MFIIVSCFLVWRMCHWHCRPGSNGKSVYASFALVKTIMALSLIAHHKDNQYKYIVLYLLAPNIFFAIRYLNVLHIHMRIFQYSALTLVMSANSHALAAFRILPPIYPCHISWIILKIIFPKKKKGFVKHKSLWHDSRFLP